MRATRVDHSQYGAQPDTAMEKHADSVSRYVESRRMGVTAESTSEDCAYADGWNAALVEIAELWRDERARWRQVKGQRDGLFAAKDRTVDYIETAMRPISVKEACMETSWDRAHRSGLQHALNAIRVEFAKVEGE